MFILKRSYSTISRPTKIKLSVAEQNLYKSNIEGLNKRLRSIAIGMILSDATMYKTGKTGDALIKFEQGYKQRDLVYNLYNEFYDYTFGLDVNIRMDSKDNNKVKSYWFKTFRHKTFTDLWNLFYIDNKKVIKPNLIINEVDGLALAYWIMGDGSLHKRDNYINLNTQGFSKEMNEIISNELNIKFGFNSYVTVNKKVNRGDKIVELYVVKIPSYNAKLLVPLIKEHMLYSFEYKIPKII